MEGVNRTKKEPIDPAIEQKTVEKEEGKAVPVDSSAKELYEKIRENAEREGLVIGTK